MVSSVPELSPAATRARYSESNCVGCRAKLSARPLPPATSSRSLWMSPRSAGLPVLPAMTFSDRTSGIAERTIVANWRVKTAMSSGRIRFRFPNQGFGLRRSRRGWIPCWRSRALARARLAALISPSAACPWASVPRQLNSTCCRIAVTRPRTR